MRDVLRRLHQQRMLHYLVAGGASFLTEYGSFLLLYYVLDWSAVVSNTVSFILSLVTSFSLNKWWVFQARGTAKQGTRQLAIYAAVATANVIVTDIAIHLLVAMDVPAFVAKMALIILVAISNFFVFKKFVFAR